MCLQALLGLRWLPSRCCSSHLLDVVYHRKEFPLRAHLALTAKREPPHTLVLKVGENRFNGSHASAVEFSSEGSVELAPHSFCGSVFLGAPIGWRTFAMFDDGQLSLERAVRVSKTLRSQVAITATGERCL